MNQEAYTLIMEAVTPELTGHNYTQSEDGSYFTDGKAVIRVVYDEEKTMFRLQQTVMDGEQPVEDWKTLSGWLFHDDSPLKDAKSIANDFTDSLREFMGVKPTLQKTVASAIPSRGNPGDDPTPAALAGRFLTVFPQYKDRYAEYVTEGGTFLYVHFFEEIAAPHFGELLDADDKKRIVKFCELLNEVYCNGDKEARACVAACIMGKALRGNSARLAQCEKYMAEAFPFLLTAAKFGAAARPAKVKKPKAAKER